MTLTFEFDPDRAKLNHFAKYLSQKSFGSKVAVLTQPQLTDCSTSSATKVVGNYFHKIYRIMHIT